MAHLTKARERANKWIREQAKDVTGKVLSVGSGGDQDNEGGHYRQYFLNASSYETSDFSKTAPVNLYLDVRSMPEVKDETYDCVFASGLIEHVDDMWAAMREINRIMKPGGVLLFGAPFGAAIHRAPQDFWRMTIHGLRYTVETSGFEISCIETIPGIYDKGFPAAYWSRSIKRIPS